MPQFPVLWFGAVIVGEGAIAGGQEKSYCKNS
jgi:hypothetical protein